MNRLLSALIFAVAITGCATDESDAIARVEALEARYHTHTRQIEELQAKVAALDAAKGPTVIDLVPTTP